MRKDPDAVKDYPAFIVNRILGGFIDTLLYVNQLNIREFADKQMQYDYLINAVSKRKRFNRKIEVDNNLNISLVMEHYNYNRERALEILPLLTDEKLAEMKASADKGGR